MDSNLPTPNEENNEQKAEFRKLPNETAHRKYRRRSPLSDEDGSPKREHSSRRDSEALDYERRNDSYRHSSRGSRHDEHAKHGKHGDENDRSHAKSSYRTGRDSRADTYSDSRDRGSDYSRSRDHHRDVDRNSRDRSDVASKKYKEPYSGRSRYDGRHDSKYDDNDRYSRDKDHRDDKRESKTSWDHRGDFKSKWQSGSVKDLDGSKCNETSAKRQKSFDSEDNEARKGDDISGSKLTADKATVSGPDSVACVDAAKVAAMKAAELVNKNLTSAGIMTADQKKKLLWGNKKSTTVEETSHRWDSAMFSDRERQEKFNKLMGVKGEVKAAPKLASSQEAEKLQVDLEKQYTAGLRRRDGRTVGLGL